MPWEKRGLIFKTEGQAEWMQTHAQVPTALVKDDRIRIFFAARNNNGQSRPGYIDVERDNPSKIIYSHKEPVLDFGKPGTFDDCGVMPNHILEHDNKIYMYYSGWNRGVSVPYRNSMGIAISEDGGNSFYKPFEGPILDRTMHEPHIAVTPSVLKEKDIWHMWYVSGLRWENINGKYEPVYVIKYASSKDGINWDRPNKTCIHQKHAMEAHSCPTVIKDGDTYKMWFSYRDSNDYRDGKGSYRIGYAESKNAVDWVRDDESAGIETSTEGWDSTMLCYPNVVEVGGKYVMFYNGNGFGKSGMGYAVWE